MIKNTPIKKTYGKKSNYDVLILDAIGIFTHNLRASHLEFKGTPMNSKEIENCIITFIASINNADGINTEYDDGDLVA